MKKLDRHEVGTVAVKGGGGPNAGLREKIYEQLSSLQVGEAITVTKKEWGIQSSPRWIVNRLARNRDWKSKFSVRTFIDETGWLITRIK